jgi:prepilin-type N-terminal cleavage/methylation domain-containing protein
MSSHRVCISKPSQPDHGFSLIELMVAIAIFLVVSASVLMLFSNQQSNASQQQGLTGLNIGMRNAIAQMQLDMANLGTSSNSAVLPNWPLGVTVVNNVTTAGTSCYSGGVYGVNCFDQINILDSDPTVPPINATNSTGGTANGLCSTTTSGTAYGQAASGQTLATTAAYYNQGDQLLFLNSTGTQITTGVLTQAPTVYNSVAVKFTFADTNSDGSNYTPSGANFNIASNTATNDPLDITACGGGISTTCTQATDFGTSFCTGDWIIKLRPIIYYVNSTNSSDPQLMRKQGTGTAVTVMDQIIGFKVGAAIFNGTDGTGTWGTSYYFYNPATYTIVTTNDSAYLFSLVRSLRVSLIGRTQPSSNPAFTFRNAFDQGAYYVQGASVVVAPRNVSMND